MMRYLKVIFLVGLFFEILSIVWVADWLGGGWTLLLMILSFCTGVFMLRRLGLSGVLLAVSAVRSGGQVSLWQLLLPIRYAFAGVLLLSPGFVSTVLALLLMLPIRGGAVVLQGRYTHSSRSRQDDDVIEGEFTVSQGEQRQKKSVDFLEYRD